MRNWSKGKKAYGDRNQEPYTWNFYKKLYTETPQWRPGFQDVQCPVITEEVKEVYKPTLERVKC